MIKVIAHICLFVCKRSVTDEHYKKYWQHLPNTVPVNIDVVYRRTPIILCKGFKLPQTSTYVASKQQDFLGYKKKQT